MRPPYQAPVLVDYGSICECTFATPHGNIKGGGPCWHYDKFAEQSGVPCS